MKYALALSAAALVAVSAAYAGSKKDDMKAMPDEAAMNARMEAHFMEVDANADGQISEDELVAFVTAKARSDFASMAGDDNLVSYDEMKAHHKMRHDMMMKDHGDMKMDGKKMDDKKMDGKKMDGMSDESHEGHN